MMVLHNFECRRGHITEKFVDVESPGWRSQPCDYEGCARMAEHVYVSRHMQALLRKPIVIYKNAMGEVRFPGSADEPMPQNYKDQGFQRVEMNFHEARKFQREYAQDLQFKESDKLEFIHYMESELRKEDRQDLIREMRRFSAHGREFAQYVIEQSNSEDARKYYSHDPGFHIEAIES